MRLLTDLSEYNWIADGVLETSPGTVAHCIPPTFQSYAKVFHSLYEDLSVRDEELTWQEEDKAKPLGPEPKTETERILADVLSESTLVYGGPSSDSRLVRIRWAELARRLRMPFLPTISAESFTRCFPSRSWPRHLIGPDEGNFVGPERDALVSVLRRHTRVDRILFRFWWVASFEGSEDKLFEGTLDEVEVFPSEALKVRLTPTHWFPDDRSWLVCSDYDSTFTLVAGSECLIRDLLEHPDLECVPVRPDTLIGWNADLEGNVH